MVESGIRWQYGSMLIDTHCHLADTRLSDTVDTLLANARAAGVCRWIVPTARCEEWPRLSLLANTHAGIQPAYGIHPWYCAQPTPDQRTWLKHLSTAVAVGECGLDLGAQGPPLTRQLEVFRHQLALARQLDLPVIIHAHKALDLVLKELRKIPVQGVIHAFAGSSQQAEQCLKLGLKLGIGMRIRQRRALRWRETVRALPLHALLLETDAPDGLPHAQNEPARLLDVARELAMLRHMDTSALIDACNHNARQLFRL
ncbi:MAG: TatD family deoxyribonuclease [Zetaproteobacteria bacterium]|nr:MAG: TatD family deoxyribonuclease [Zetaproteobacteria bacterium]